VGLIGLECVDLCLLLADHAQQAVLRAVSIRNGGVRVRNGAKRTTWPSCSDSSAWCSSPRLGARSRCGGLCVYDGPLLRDEGLRCISPGAGTVGSLRFRFMRMLERRRARSTSRCRPPEEGLRVSSLWIPAFMAAVAASEWGEDAMVREAEGEWLREVLLEGDARGEGGSVLRSGGDMVGRCGLRSLHQRRERWSTTGCHVWYERVGCFKSCMPHWALA
jgi:hypothetical protein